MNLEQEDRDIMLLALDAYQLNLKDLADSITREAIKDEIEYEEMRAMTDPFDAKRQEIVDLAAKVRSS